jgi:hypothetical protein
VTLNQVESNIENHQVTEEEGLMTSSKVNYQLKHSESSFKLDGSMTVNDIEQGREIILDKANIALFGGDIHVESTSCEQAWNYNDSNDRKMEDCI